MDKTQKEVSVTGDVARERMLSRRRILRTGALVAPAIITLQSGAAWAQSMSCAEKIYFPVVNDDNKGYLMNLLVKGGVSNQDKTTVVQQFQYPEYDASLQAHNIFLQIEAASCYASIYPA